MDCDTVHVVFARIYGGIELLQLHLKLFHKLRVAIVEVYSRTKDDKLISEK